LIRINSLKTDPSRISGASHENFMDVKAADFGVLCLYSAG
jgi:hypothetical protein